MKAIKTLIVWIDETRKDKISADINLLTKSEIVSKRYDEDFDIEEVEADILIADIDQGNDKKAIPVVLEITEKLKAANPKIMFMLSGKISAAAKKKFQDFVDVFSGLTALKVKNDYRKCIDLLIVKNNKLNYYLTDFFAPHLVGDFERTGFELVLNDTYDREAYKENFLELWRSFMLIAPILTEENRTMLKKALHTYEERNLTQEEKDEIESAFFFQFNSLYSLHNFSERRLYYMEKPVIETVWESIIIQARSIDNSLLFGCHKSMHIVRLKLMIHKAYSLKKITKSSELYKTLSMIEPYADVVVTSEGERLVIGSEPEIKGLDVEDTPSEDENLTFNFYFKVIVPHRRRRGLKRA